MIRKKYIFGGIALSLVVIGGTIVGVLNNKYKNDEEYNIDSSINSYSTIKQSEDIQDVNENDPNDSNTYTMEYTMNLSSTVDYSDINQLKNLAEDIVIAKVTSVDGGTNYSEGLEMYTSNNTIGEIQILQSLKGDLSVNDVVPFIRCGGTVETTEYIKNLNDKRKYLLEQAENSGQETMLDYKYVKEIEAGDIEIEEGKTYLMFICYDQYNQRYEIFGQQYGLREYESNTEMVMNNVTNEKESLSSLNLN